MRLSRLNEYNMTASEPLKNARNGAAGAIRNLNPEVTAQRGLSFLRTISVTATKRLKLKRKCVSF